MSNENQLGDQEQVAETDGDPTGGSPTEIAFDYIKSPHFRVIHADGIFGGITPRGYIHMAVWNQRKPIPKRVVHRVDEGGVGEELSREGRDAIVREVDVGVMMDLPLARSVLRWLEDKIQQAEGLIEAEESEES